MVRRTRKSGTHGVLRFVAGTAGEKMPEYAKFRHVGPHAFLGDFLELRLGLFQVFLDLRVHLVEELVHFLFLVVVAGLFQLLRAFGHPPGARDRVLLRTDDPADLAQAP